jgi:hypothetical protein
MADPIITKAPLKPLESAIDQDGAGPAKTGESKFDKVRNELMDQKAQQVEIPPEIKHVSLEHKKVLEAELSQRLKQTGPAPAHKLFAPDMKRAKEGIEHLNKRVDALPKTPAFEPFRKRLASIDAQYQNAGQLMNSVTGNASPGDLLKIQMQMYQLTENMELMSKVVSQVTSGVKSILQTQV